jgi:hypothetical protein
MIRINLLPPEFRKRRGTGLNPEMLGLAAGVVVSLIVVGFWGYVNYVRIPFAESRIAELDADLAVAKRQADEVRAIEKEILGFEARLKVLDDLIKQKVPWAQTISDFADVLGRDRWTMGGFQVSSRGLSISPTSGAGGGRRGRDDKQGLQYNFRWDMELVGEDFNLAGNYVRTFFADVKDTEFWFDNGFVGDPVEPYTGDRPEVLTELKKVRVAHSLVWVRSQDQEAENAKVAADRAAAAARQGNQAKQAPKEDG